MELEFQTQNFVVGRDLLLPSSTPLLLTQGQLDNMPRSCPDGFRISPRKLCDLSGQTVTVLKHLHRKKKVLFLVFRWNLKFLSLCPLFLSCLSEESGSAGACPLSYRWYDWEDFFERIPDKSAWCMTGVHFHKQRLRKEHFLTLNWLLLCSCLHKVKQHPPKNSNQIKSNQTKQTKIPKPDARIPNTLSRSLDLVELYRNQQAFQISVSIIHRKIDLWQGKKIRCGIHILNIIINDGTWFINTKIQYPMEVFL